jgi:EmrB/QacA subfamily drug resistance transporter
MRPKTSRWFAVWILCAGQLMIIVDQNIVNVALPTIQRDLGFAQESLVWVVNAYVVPFGGLLLLAGRLGDLVGRKAVFVAGLVTFTVASLLCGLAGSPAALIGFRILQGVGGGFAAAGILGMIVALFPVAAADGGPGTGRDRARAIGAFSFASASGGTLGGLLGGVLTDTAGWHWIFFINGPIGAAVIALAVWGLPGERGAGLGAGADGLGAALVTGGLMLAVYAAVGGAHRLAAAALAAALLVGFAIRERQAAAPLVPRNLFRSGNLLAANGIQLLMIAAMFGLLYFGGLYLQRVLHFDPLRAGLGFAPAAIVIAVVSLGVAARAVLRFGPGAVLRGGLVGIALGFGWLARVPERGHYAADVLPALLVIGLGFGLAIQALTVLGLSDVGPADTGVASGLFNTTQQIGGALGLTALSAIATAGHDALPLAGYHRAFALAAGFAVVALVVAGGLRRRLVLEHAFE